MDDSDGTRVEILAEVIARTTAAVQVDFDEDGEHVYVMHKDGGVWR